MKNKKTDVLANELMNDLLEDETAQTQIEQGKKHIKDSESLEKPGTSGATAIPIDKAHKSQTTPQDSDKPSKGSLSDPPPQQKTYTRRKGDLPSEGPQETTIGDTATVLFDFENQGPSQTSSGESKPESLQTHSQNDKTLPLRKEPQQKEETKTKPPLESSLDKDATIPIDINAQSKVVQQDTIRPYSTTFKSIPRDTAPLYKSAGELSSAEIALVQSQHLQIAQDKIIDLEEEIEALRLDNDRLTAAGETLKSRNEDLTSQLEEIQRSTNEELEQIAKEKEIISTILQEKEKRVNELLTEKDRLEMRLKSNFRKIRVRERELENRLELIRMEHMAINQTKDEVVLDLKRQIDQLSLELDSFRNKGQELNQQLNEKREALQRTVKALRLALIMLESGEPSSKKSG